MKTMRVVLAALLCVLAGHPGSAAAQTPLARAVAEARPLAIAPHATPPRWIAWDGIQRGLAFYERHRKPIGGVLATSSLVATYAAVDIAPVLMRTGRLARDYDKRIDETGEWIDAMVKPQSNLDSFLAENYRRAFDLGKLHASIAASMSAKDLGWRAAERVPVNQQAYALVLYSFAWQPLESMAAMHALDVAADSADVDGWCHLWSVLGYAMGEEEELLPRSYSRAAEIIPLLRSRQYAQNATDVPPGVPVLLRGELRMLMAPRAGAPPTPADVLQRRSAEMLANAISLSPGLQRALGLSDQPVDDLLKLVRPSP